MKCSFAWLLLAACGPTIGVLEAGTTTGTSGATIDSGPMSDPTNASPTTTAADPMDDSGGGPFLVLPDVGDARRQCDAWTNNCPVGEKCMPWAHDGGSSWSGMRCSPIAEDPKDVGEPCSVEGGPASGIDDCGLGALCWDVFPETGRGECVAMCVGSEANPSCADPCEACSISSNAFLALCLPRCDPIAQDCSEGQGCYAVSDDFVCSPDASGDQGIIGDPCEYLNVCDRGTFCASAEMVPGCTGSTGCCTPFCDAAAIDGCDAVLPGTSCVPWFEVGHGLEGCIGGGIIGACVVPA